MGRADPLAGDTAAAHAAARYAYANVAPTEATLAARGIAYAAHAAANAHSLFPPAFTVDYDPVAAEDSNAYDSRVESARAAAEAAYAYGTRADSARAAARGKIIAAMWADFDLLSALARHERWTDETPVDPDLCGPLWPNGAPEGWPAEEPPPDAIGGLTITFEVPDGVSEEDALAKINEFVDRANDLHRALGGHGLRLIPPIEATQCVAARQGVSS